MKTSTSLDHGRTAFAEHRWSAAYEALRRADDERGLAPADLERLSTATLLLGRDAEGIDVATRAHEAHLEGGNAAGAARIATWIGIYLMGKGDGARANGWLARARRIADATATGVDSSAALLLVAAALDHLASGDPSRAERTFAEAFAIAARVHDRDATALAQLGQGQALLMLGDAVGGLALLDEVMVAVTAGEISPVASGVVYCQVINTCHLAFDVRRAQQWTIALDRWCGDRPEMVMFSGQCQVHRAELYRFHGAWGDAVTAARVAQDRTRLGDWTGSFGAWYQEGEVQRLRGEFDAAERAFHRAAETGYPAQPGLALLRLAQGRARLARSSIDEAVDEADPATRRGLLAAVVEIDLAVGDLAAARRVADELTVAATVAEIPMLHAVAAGSEAAVRLEEGDAREIGRASCRERV